MPIDQRELALAVAARHRRVHRRMERRQRRKRPRRVRGLRHPGSVLEDVAERGDEGGLLRCVERVEGNALRIFASPRRRAGGEPGGERAAVRPRSWAVTLPGGIALGAHRVDVDQAGVGRGCARRLSRTTPSAHRRCPAHTGSRAWHMLQRDCDNIGRPRRMTAAARQRARASRPPAPRRQQGDRTPCRRRRRPRSTTGSLAFVAHVEEVADDRTDRQHDREDQPVEPGRVGAADSDC